MNERKKFDEEIKEDHAKKYQDPFQSSYSPMRRNTALSFIGYSKRDSSIRISSRGSRSPGTFTLGGFDEALLTDL